MAEEGVIMPDEQPDSSGGMGGLPDKDNHLRRRQHLRLLEEAVYKGWNIPPEAASVLPREVYAIASDPNASPRDRIRATELIAALRKADIEAAVQLDRIYRLDQGSATENVAVIDLSEEALQAVARSLAARNAAKPCAAKPRRKR